MKNQPNNCKWECFCLSKAFICWLHGRQRKQCNCQAWCCTDGSFLALFYVEHGWKRRRNQKWASGLQTWFLSHAFLHVGHWVAFHRDWLVGLIGWFCSWLFICSLVCWFVVSLVKNCVMNATSSLKNLDMWPLQALCVLLSWAPEENCFEAPLQTFFDPVNSVSILLKHDMSCQLLAHCLSSQLMWCSDDHINQKLNKIGIKFPDFCNDGPECRIKCYWSRRIFFIKTVGKSLCVRILLHPPERHCAHL